MSDLDKEREAIRSACNAAEVHLNCSYPQCSCAAMPRAVRAVLSSSADRDAVLEEAASICSAEASKKFDAGWTDCSLELSACAAAIRALQGSPRQVNAAGQVPEVREAPGERPIASSPAAASPACASPNRADLDAAILAKMAIEEGGDLSRAGTVKLAQAVLRLSERLNTDKEAG